MSLDNAKVFLFDVNFNEELRTKLNDIIPAGLSQDEQRKISEATSAALKLGYDFTEDELKEAMLESNDANALELKAVTKHSGVCISQVEDRDSCAATVESGVWCTAQTSPATVGSKFMAM